MSQERIKQLLKLYADNAATKEEVEEVFGFIKSGESDVHLEQMIAESYDEEPAITLLQENCDQVWNKIHSEVRATSKKRLPVLFIKRYVAAASLLLMMGSAFLFMVYKKNEKKTGIAASNAHTNDIKPGGNKATLTLADGSVIMLDTAKNGYVANQSNTKIIKLNTGLLSYKKEGKNEGKVLFNTITTPRGGQYQLELPDGTVVWLNAASSLIFPTAFVGKERRVELKGEAYFEVAKNAAMPFHVTASNTNITVLGTHFNIMSYAEEQNISTTLLEGGINLTANGVTKNLQPGRQVDLNRTTNNLDEHNANIKQVMAWKNGEFRFKETGIKELMRQVGRWYDVDVEYKTKSTNQYFTASLPRMQNVSALLQMLELTGTVHFKIDNKKIIVLP